MVFMLLVLILNMVLFLFKYKFKIKKIIKIFQVGIYVEETNEAMCLIESHVGGITHLKFSSDGNRLFSGARKDSDIICWDIR
jgi:hypothetical protein